jgi:hypothetical protein
MDEPTDDSVPSEQARSIIWQGVPHIHTFTSPPYFIRRFAQNPVLKRSHGSINVHGKVSQEEGRLQFSRELNMSYEKIDHELCIGMRGPQIYSAYGRHLGMTDFQHIVNWVRFE